MILKLQAFSKKFLMFLESILKEKRLKANAASIFFSKSIFYIDIHCQNLSISDNLPASNVGILNVAPLNSLHKM